MPPATTAPEVIEGTWEEISLLAAKLRGHRVRLEILPNTESAPNPNAPLLDLLQQWEEEDAQLSTEERLKTDAIYDAIEKNGIPRVRI
ncbi:MAG: hypothetical protein QM758_10660 [Armatimonas sp.]